VLCAWPAAAVDASQADDGPSKQLVALTNLSRTSNGFSSLPADARLNSIARSRSEDMIARRYFSHTIPPDGKTVVDIIESLGIRFRAGSENIAFNDALDFVSLQMASDDFMNSLSHRANVLNGRWHRVGAAAVAGDGRKMYTVVFLELPGDSSSPAPGATRVDGGSIPPAQRPRPAGEPVQMASAPTGLMDSVVNRSVRLFLSL
jgi:hypothetical protein